MSQREVISITLEGKDNASDDFDRVTRKMNGFDRQARNTRDATSGLASSLGGLKTAAGAAGIAFVATAAVDLAGQFNEMGSVVNQTDNIFKELTETQENYEMTLSRLQETTFNSVSNMELMAGANQLMRMRIAENTDEVVALIDMATKLKQPTDSASEAIENFSLMLANQSVARLDSFGISSARVRERIDELLDSGQALNREEAFKMAVLDEGAVAIDRLGDSIEQNVSQMDIFHTRLGNVAESIAGGFADAVDIAMGKVNELTDTTVSGISLLGIGLEHGFDELAEMNRLGVNYQHVQDSAELAAEAYIQYFRDYAGEHFAEEVGGRIAETALNSEVAQKIIEFGNARVLLEDQSARDSLGLSAVDITSFLETVGGPNMSSDDLEKTMNVVWGYSRALRIQAAETERAERATAQYNKQVEMSATFTSLAELASTGLEHARSDEFRLLNDLQASYDMMTDSFSFGGTVSGIELFDPADVDAVQWMADSLQSGADSIKEAAENNHLIQQGDVDRMQQLADDAQSFAERATTAAEQFENMSLSTALGNGDGGRYGEMLDMVLANLDEDTADDFSSSADIASGRQSKLASDFETLIVPMLTEITNTQGVARGVDATGIVNDALDVAMMNQLSREDTIALIEQAVGFRMGSGGEGASYTIQPFGSYTDAAALAGISPQDILANQGVSDPMQLQAGTFSLGGGTELLPVEQGDLFAQYMDDANESVQSATDTVLEELGLGLTTAVENATALDDVMVELENKEYTLSVAMELFAKDATGATLGNMQGFQNAVNIAMRTQGITVAGERSRVSGARA